VPERHRPAALLLALGLLPALAGSIAPVAGPAAAREVPPRRAGVPVPNVPTPLPPKVLDDGRTQLALIDFGPRAQVAPWRVAFGTDRRDPSWAWSGGMVRQRTRKMSQYGPLLCDFVEGENASFLAAVEPRDVRYRVDLHLGDPERARGPLDIHAGGRRVASGVVTEAGESKRITLEIQPDADGRIDIRLSARDCGSWALQAADVWGPKGARFLPLFPDPETRSAVPPVDSLALLDVRHAPRVLGEFGDFLLEWRPDDGAFSEVGAWYQNAYPVRTLLAAGLLLDRDDFREAAFSVLDRFCNEQRPTGGWYSTYFGRDGCGLAAAPDTSSANLADIGTMSLCLALAAPHASPERAERYLAAARRYADEVVLPAQDAEGWFPNGLYMGRDHGHPYSVATACQAGSLAVLGAVTGEIRYLEAAERAGVWLSDNVRENGDIVFAPHDTSRVRLIKPTDFGDAFYLMEGLAWTARYAIDPASHHRIERVRDRLLTGPGGLRDRVREGYWYRPVDPWSDSKMGGVLYLLADAPPEVPDADRDLWMSRIFAWLADPGLSRRIGVRAPPPAPGGEYALAATGFAGIGLAALIDPDVLAPVSLAHPAGSKPAAPRHRPR
jgi:hypothetical protein